MADERKATCGGCGRIKAQLLSEGHEEGCQFDFDIPGGPVPLERQGLIVPATSGVGRIAAERTRQQKRVTCPGCKGTGRGRERLNHMDNTPTGDYFNCPCCHGTKVTGWSDEHDDKYKNGQLAWAAVCFAAPERVYRADGGGSCITFNDPWPCDWDKQRWDSRTIKRPTRAERIRLLEKSGALIAAEIDRLLRLGDE